MAKVLTDASYGKRDKKAEKAKGTNFGGFRDLTPKVTKK